MYYNQNYNAYPQGYPNSVYGNSFNSPMQPQIRSEIVKVNGENGAKAYQLAPNSSALLLDESSPIVWLVQSDGAGYKTITPYSITPYQAEPPVNTKDLESRISRLEEIVNGKSDITSTKRSKSANAEQQ